MNDVLILLSRLIGLFLGMVVIYLIPSLKEWFDVKIESINDESLRKMVRTAVLAAEQCLKSKDPTGKIRHDFVTTELKEAGIDLTNEILDMIEEEVFSLGHQKHENGE